MLENLSINSIKKSFDNSTYRFTSIPDIALKGHFGVYIHVPFCLSKCNFCPFYKEILNEDDKDRYLAAIRKEIETSQISGTADWVYFGGGTPNVLSIQELNGIIAALKQKVTIGRLSIELLPALLDDDYLKALKECGFDMVSIGVESLSKTLMKESSRHVFQHEKMDPLISTALSYGLWVNTDLMVGFPGQSADSFLTDIDIMASIMPSQITLYPFTNIRGFKSESSLPDQEQFELIEHAGEHLIEKGYNRTGIWTFALGEDLYDSLRDELTDRYIGFGPAAFSTFDNWKVVNPDLQVYLKTLQHGQHMGFVAPRSNNAENWRQFAHAFYDLTVNDFNHLPGSLRNLITLLKLNNIISNGFLTKKGIYYTHRLIKTLVETLPLPHQDIDSVENYKDYLDYMNGNEPQNRATLEHCNNLTI